MAQDNPFTQSHFNNEEVELDHLDMFIVEQNEIIENCRSMLRKATPKSAAKYLRILNAASHSKAEILGVFPWMNEAMVDDE